MRDEIEAAVEAERERAVDPAHHHHHPSIHHAVPHDHAMAYSSDLVAAETGNPMHHPDNPIAHLPAARTTSRGSNAKDSGSADERAAELQGGVVNEKGQVLPVDLDSRHMQAELERPPGRLTKLYIRHRLVVHVAIWAVFTAWWVAGLVLHNPQREQSLPWVFPFLLWLFVTLRLVFFHVPFRLVSRPVKALWAHTAVPAVNLIPKQYRNYCGAALTVAVFLVASMASPESLDNTRANRAVSLFGLLVFVAVLYATSRSRKDIPWATVQIGLITQIIIALFVLRTGVGYSIFNFISELARDLLGFAGDGTAFLTDSDFASKGWFVVSVLPPIIFFVSIVQMLYYMGVLQFFIEKFSLFFYWSMGISGAESVAAAAAPFIGQGENAILIKPFVPNLTSAEIHQVMTSGFATIAGSVFVAYVSLGINPEVLLSSCVMSIPASIAVSKIRYPETEQRLTDGECVVPEDTSEEAVNFLHALTNGAWLGVKIAVAIMAMLLVIIATVALVSGILFWFGKYVGWDYFGEGDSRQQFGLEFIVGYLFYPVAFLLGAPRHELYPIGRLIGIKVIQNEFVAFSSLVSDPMYATLTNRGKVICAYSVCGFGNIGSIGNQISIFRQIAPARQREFATIAPSAFVTGVIATLMSAAVAAMVIDREFEFTA